jgi:hypothetical protein
MAWSWVNGRFGSFASVWYAHNHVRSPPKSRRQGDGAKFDAMGRKLTRVRVRDKSGNSFRLYLNDIWFLRNGVWAGLHHAVVTNTQPRVRINRQPLEQRSQFWPEAVSTKSGDRMKLLHVVLLGVLGHDRISHGSIHPISEWLAAEQQQGSARFIGSEMLGSRLHQRAKATSVWDRLMLPSHAAGSRRGGACHRAALRADPVARSSP